MATIPSQYVLNDIITLPSNLIYNDQYGNPVYQLFPWDYLVLVGMNVNNLKSSYTSLSAQVATQSSQISVLQALTSGITAPYQTPKINGLCLNQNVVEAIDSLLSKQITAWCDLVTVLGTNAALTSSIAQECNGLSSDTSFSIPGGTMGSIVGWIPSPVTIADTLTNIWLTICDLRGGMVTLFDAITPTCAQCVVNFASYIPSYSAGINIYFEGYTFLPNGFADNGSSITIKDSAGNIYTQSVDLLALSMASKPLNINLSATALIPTSSYTITLDSILFNRTLNITCQKTTIQTLINTLSICPVLGITPSRLTASFTMQPIITSSVTYNVDLLDASGGTLQTQTYSNPSSIVVGTFSSLSSNTVYGIKVVSTITGATPVICATQSFTTLV